MKRPIWWALISGICLLSAVALGWRLHLRRLGAAAKAVDASALYSGKEPKRRIKLSFPSNDKPGFNTEEAEIYATADSSAQLKQVLLLLFKGPASKGSAAPFPGAWAYREAYITDKGLAVIDLEGASVALHGGGTSGEYASLYSLMRTLIDNFASIKRMQVLVDGKTAESLAGHIDISEPLSLSDF